jgi:multidrug efflux pump subunit AcrB
VENKTTIYILTVILVVFGIMQYNSTPKEQMPEIVFPFFMVGTVYPGSSPTDIENLITRPIEKQLKGIDGVKEISSNSIQDYSGIFIEFELSVDEMQAYLDVRQAIDDAMADLPADLLSPPELTRIELSDQPIIYVNLSGDVGRARLKDYAEDLQDEIEALEEISRVAIAGALDREIQVNVDLYKMQASGLTFDSISRAVSMENMTISGGMIDKAGMKKALRVSGEFERVDQIANILLTRGIYLKDIAEVKDGFADVSSYSRLNGKEVVTLNVIKKSGQNMIIAVEKVMAIVDQFTETKPDNLTVSTTGDSSERTKKNISDLFNTIILGFFVVVLVLMFFMGIKNALFVGIAIPMSIVIAFICVPLVGFTMNTVVLMAFILVLGIVVDNAIVVVENIYRHFTTTENLPILPAAKRGAGEIALAVFTGTLTTMAPFFPLVFFPGIAGKFVSFLPVTVIITLTASMLVAYVMNPVFAVSFMKWEGEEPKTFKSQRPDKKRMIFILIAGLLTVLLYASGNMLPANIIAFVLIMYLLTKFVLAVLIDKFQRRFVPAMKRGYRKVLTFLLKGKRPYLIVATMVFLFFFSFILMGIKTPKIVFFPEGAPNNIMIYIKMPEGTHIDVTDSIARDVEEKIVGVLGEDNPDVESIVTNVAVNAGSGMFDRSQQEKLAKVAITFVEYKDRTGKSTWIYLDELRKEIVGIPGAEIEITKEAMGPPSGKPINIEISGEDISELVSIAERLKKYIESQNIKGIEQLKSDMETSKPEMVLHIDRDKALRLGINTAQIGMLLRTAIAGSRISKFKEGDEEYSIQLRLHEKYRNDIDVLLSQEVRTMNGSSIPLSAVARIEHETTYGGITHLDNERVITLSSNVLSGYNPTQIIFQIIRALPGFPLKEGYEINFTGEQEMQQEAAAFLVKAMFISAALIFIILVTQFNSVTKPFLIITQIIFSLIGVLLGFIIFGMDISVMITGMGIIAVAGIVVKNGIIIVDYTDRLMVKGGDKLEAVVQAGETRLTPVLLTALSTILGLVPLTTGTNFNWITLFTSLDPQIYFGGDMAAFWAPLGYTIIFGLTFATILTLIVIPAMYTIGYVRRGKRKTA